MRFYDKLQTFIDSEVQVFLPVDTIIGTLLSTDENITRILTNRVPAYGGTAIANVATPTIAYVRVFTQ